MNDSTTCKWCGKETSAVALKECPGCWELRSRIESQPEMAMRMMQEIIGRDHLSDGYHSFAELYQHRHHLFAMVAQLLPERAWRSKLHADGTMFEGYFIAGLDLLMHDLQKKTISYHVPLAYWGLFDGIRELLKAPEWDGHTSEDVVVRIRQWLRE